MVKQPLNKVKDIKLIFSFHYILFLAKQLIANKKKISFEEAKRLDKNNESMPPWQQLHPSSSGIGSSSTASSNSGSSSPRVAGTSSVTSSSPVNTLADASSSVTTNLLMDSTNTNCNGNDKTSGKSTTRTK